MSFFPAFLKKGKDAEALKDELLEAIAPLDRGADASPQDQQRVDQVHFFGTITNTGFLLTTPSSPKYKS